MIGTRRRVLLTAVESVRTEPVRRAVFAHAKLVHVMEGRIELETASGSRELWAGSALLLGVGHWCSIRPLPSARLWTVYVDDSFFRAHMRWILSDIADVDTSVRVDTWDGSAVVLQLGQAILRRNERVWRQMSVACQQHPTGLAAARLISLFTQTVEVSLPTLLDHRIHESVGTRAEFPIRGALARPLYSPPVRKAITLLRSTMTEPWSIPRLSGEIAMSKAHLTRQFNEQVGVAPMRFLTEVRLTEFTRLIEETELSVSAAAEAVGWDDARVATRWFRRRFGTSPSHFRLHPHPQSESLPSEINSQSVEGSPGLAPSFDAQSDS
ncbi:helix-turn-helix transcriptional regulator [Herbiconiux moechotypicola]|uniref:HTH araC/xylS-type domain-containing protein n=1 Tax=Herbiconiux moechotypicola TaxID=637393 RepID=A0ABP5QA01_9MICO|nr:helix-turn-helix transcriptional regulator [Herbiconiux moechotypicola]MCS5729423.1 helix-turn-helix transcriptional regulator [Herbiconiux moechotypicola]